MADDIIANEHAYLEQGGHFIVPIPEPRVVGAPQAAVVS